MTRLLVGAAGTLLGSTAFAAGTASIATNGGWLRTLGSFALGGLLGSFFGGSSFAAAFILTVLVIVAVVAMRIFVKPQSAPVAPAVQLAGLGVPLTAAMPPSKSAESEGAAFLRAAKLNFVKLNLAIDLGSLDRIRDLATAETYEGLRSSGGDRGGLPRGQIVSLNADLLKRVRQRGGDLASVRFSGTMRQAPGAAPVDFEEIWSLFKPVDSASGWLLAAIQQKH